MASIGIAIVIPDPYAEQLRRWRAGFEDVGNHPVPPHVTPLVAEQLTKSRPVGRLSRTTTLVAVCDGSEVSLIKVLVKVTFDPTETRAICFPATAAEWTGNFKAVLIRKLTSFSGTERSR